MQYEITCSIGAYGRTRLLLSNNRVEITQEWGEGCNTR